MDGPRNLSPYGKIMGQILWAKLDGLVKTREEEMEFTKGVPGK